jgi:hypothetical protein
MATSHNTFEKRQRERNRAARAAEKRAKRLERGSGEVEVDEEPDEAEQLGSREFGHLYEAGLIDALAALHQRFDDGDVDFETFEKRKAAITAQLASR